MAIVNESYMPPFALLVLDGDDNKWKIYKGLESEEFDKDEFLASANHQVLPGGTYTNNYIDAKVVPNENLDQYLEEDVEVGTDTHTETIMLEVQMFREEEHYTFDYTTSIDEVGQIVLTPTDASTKFVNVRRTSVDNTVNTLIDGTKTFVISIVANMISDNGDYDYFLDIDEIGQLVITPESENTSFLTASTDHSLNLVTECNESISIEENIDPATEEYRTKKDICLSVIDDLEDCLNTAIDKCKTITRYFSEIGIHSVDIEPYMINYLKSFIDGPHDISCYEFRERLNEYEEGSTVTEVFNEAVDDEVKQDVLNRFMQGNISIFSSEDDPDPSYIHLDELDSIQGRIVYEYYYDKESDSVVSYVRKS